MSAIFGIFYRDGRPVERETLERMQQKLDQRGTDDQGIWVENAVGLGHNMRYNTPESVYANMPMSNADQTKFLTAECRIDNREELFKTFDIPQGQRSELSDSYLILKAYEKWGTDCPKYLLGAFAFAIWDKTEQQLFCARDHMGVKPFYYYLDEEVFVFGSEIRVFWQLKCIRKQPNRIRIGDYIVGNLEDKHQTFYKDIFRLPSAHFYQIKRNATSCNRYWRLDETVNIRKENEKEYINEFRTLFSSAVKNRLRSKRGIGSLLSGGLDSSSIAFTAQHILQGENVQFNTFTAIFSHPKSNEREYAESISGDEVIQHFINAGKYSPLDRIRELTKINEEPIWGGNIYWYLPVYRRVQSKNIGVLLDGFDGDNVVSHGSRLLTEYAVSGNWTSLHNEIKQLSRLKSWSIWKLYKHFVIAPLFIDNLKSLLKIFYAIHDIPEQSINSSLPKGYAIVRDEFDEKFNLFERNYKMNISKYQKSRTSRQEHYANMETGGLSIGTELLDKLSQKFGVEQRFPFFDKQLITFCLGLPGNLKLHHGWDRYILRKSLKGVLPDKIRWRKQKADLSPHFFNSLQKEKGMRNVRAALNKAHPVLQECIDINEASLYYDHLLIEKAPFQGNTLIWKIICLNTWLKVNF